MDLPFKTDAADSINRKKFAVILVRPEKQENIGLVARAMKNTGFSDLRVVGPKSFDAETQRTAVHAGDILGRASFYSSLSQAVRRLHLVFASTARVRSKFSILPLEEAVDLIFHYPASTRVGLLFGNERTGLTSKELGAANFVFSIRQAVRQPSYNLSSAVLLTLFEIFRRLPQTLVCREKKPLPREDQDECIRVVLMKLRQSKFIHETNETHVTRRVQDLFGRLALTDKDRKLLMAIFNKAI
jgi:TrmH family RNA methyltransferase